MSVGGEGGVKANIGAQAEVNSLTDLLMHSRKKLD